MRGIVIPLAGIILSSIVVGLACGWPGGVVFFVAVMLIAGFAG